VDTSTDNANTDTDSEVSKTSEQQTPEEKDAADKAAASANSEDKATPKTVSEALKALKADPKNAGASKVLRDAYFGEQAFKKEFKTVQEARDAKAFINAIGGPEGWESTQQVIQNIEESDALVYSGDPKIWQNIVEDLKSENKMEALPKLAAGGLDTLKTNNPAQFKEVIAPHVLADLQEVNLPGAIKALDKYLAVAEKELTDAGYAGGKNGLLALKTIAGDMKSWMEGLVSEAKTKAEAATKTDPEREKFLAEKKEFEQQKSAGEQEKVKAFRNDVALECDKTSNSILKQEIASYLRMPFFKGFPRETLLDLGTGIKQALYSQLEKDRAYQIAMNGQWKQKSPDRAKIHQIHEDKMNTIAADLVKSVIERRYPGYAKGGSAAGRVAAAAEKKTAATKVADSSVQSGKPTYVAQKPKALVRDKVTIGGKEYSPSDLTMLEIGGKGFVKNTSGKYAFVTWRK
jgi:ribosomal protein S8E